MRKSQILKKGFTLIEMLVVILIIILMTGVLFMSQNSNKEQDEAEIAARQIVAQLRSLQNDMLNGKESATGEIACDAILKIAVANTNSYTTYYEKNCGPSAVTFGSLPFNLPEGATAAVITGGAPTSGSVIFTPPHGIIDSNSTNNILVTSPKGTKNSTICIDKNSGNITEFKGDVVATNCP